MKNILELLSELKPKPSIDPKFKADLYKQIVLASAEDKKEVKPSINFNFMKNFKFVLPVTALALAAIIVFVSVPKKDGKIILPGKQEIIRVSDHAYGSLAQLTTASGGRGGGGNSTAETDNMAAAPVADALRIDPGFGGGAGEPGFVPTFYKYVYKGEEFTVEGDKMEVYERQKGFGSSINLGSILDRFNVGIFDINKFKSSNLDYVRASEDRDQGYSMDLDLKQGSLYINQNWEKWGVVDYTVPVSVNELPSDEQAIATANQFLDEYGISRDNFGEPYVQNQWRIAYEKSVDRASMYVPDTVSVVYPTKISGNEIYDESGNKTGMYVSINARNKKVTSVGEITGQKFNASEYETEKDTSRLIKIAEAGGYYGYLPLVEDQNVKTTEVELGNPEIVYVRMWQSINNQSKDLYIPCLKFPILNRPADLYPQSITVPLIKEVLDSRDEQNKSTPPVRPL